MAIINAIEQNAAIIDLNGKLSCSDAAEGIISAILKI
jgi:hypothetical protein